MSKIFTTSYLNSIVNSKTLLENLNEFHAQTQPKNSFDIFLSHSYLDKVAVTGLYTELTRYGFNVYVDWIIDPDLDREHVTKESAKIIRNRLLASKSLLLAVSTQTILSKWIPWELGFIDGNTSKCAIIPVSDSNDSPNAYNGFEYLSLYPFVVKAFNTNGTENLWIVESPSQYICIEEWLHGSIPYKRTNNIF